MPHLPTSCYSHVCARLLSQTYVSAIMSRHVGIPNIIASTIVRLLCAHQTTVPASGHSTHGSQAAASHRTIHRGIGTTIRCGEAVHQGLGGDRLAPAIFSLFRGPRSPLFFPSLLHAFRVQRCIDDAWLGPPEAFPEAHMLQ